MMGSESTPIPNVFVASKAQEEIFLKNNLEYEQRLKTHLYQFDEEERKAHGSIDESQVSERQESRVYNHQTPENGDETTKMANQQVI